MAFLDSAKLTDEEMLTARKAIPAPDIDNPGWMIPHARSINRALADAAADKAYLLGVEEGRKLERVQLAPLVEALETIKRDYGQVCRDYLETCTHVACLSSVAAWMEADKALAALEVEHGTHL